MLRQSKEGRNKVQPIAKQRTQVSSFNEQHLFRYTLILHTFLENTKAMRKEQTKKWRMLIFGDQVKRSGGGEASTLDNDKDGIQLIKEMKMKQRLRKMSTINNQQLD